MEGDNISERQPWDVSEMIRVCLYLKNPTMHKNIKKKVKITADFTIQR